MTLRPGTNPIVDRLVDELIDVVAATSPDVVKEMLFTSLSVGLEGYPRDDLALMSTSLKEMRDTYRAFAPHRDKMKVAVFGSARTASSDPSYVSCVEFCREIVAMDWMVITGGGGGIMQAGNEGAGRDNSFAVNIRLPHEQSTNHVMTDSHHAITFKYFFNRKVAFLREAHAVALFPGGFGTMDEGMEVLTLLQTGKTEPLPFIFVDDRSEPFWLPFLDYARDKMLGRGLVSPEDFLLIDHVYSPQEACAVIERFYRIVHSVEARGSQMVIRLNKSLDSAFVADLAAEFAPLVSSQGEIAYQQRDKFHADHADKRELPRLLIDFDLRSYGLMRELIRRINCIA